MILLISLLCVIALLYVAYIRKTFNYWNARGVPSFSPRTPLGDLLHTIIHKQNIHLFLKDVYHHFKAQGHSFAGVYFTTGPVFVPIDYVLIKRIMSTDHEYFSERGGRTDRDHILLSDNQFSAPYKKWKYLRDLMASDLTPGKIRKLCRVTETFAKVLSEEVGKVDGPVDIYNFAHRYIVDIACNGLFGIEEDALKKGTTPMVTFVKQINTMETSDALKTMYRYGVKDPSNLMLALFMKKSLNTFIFNYATKLYQWRKNNNVICDDVLNSLIKRLEDENEPYDFVDFANGIMFFFFAIIETTSLSLTHYLYHLAAHKDLQDKVKQEIFETKQKHNGVLTGETIMEMDYLDRVFYETTRVHSTVPAVNRICVKDYKIPGSDVIIEKGTPVFISTLGPHSDPELFPNPNKFDPDRFLDPKQRQMLLTFGIGQKYCLGKKLALHVQKCALVELLEKYDIRVNPRTGDRLETAAFTKHVIFKYKNTFWLDFIKRNK